MKRLILMTMLCFGAAALPAVHIPGQLRDTINPTRSIERGVIMQTIMTDANFTAELNAIQTFIGAGRLIPSYQDILQLLQQSRSAAPSIAVIEAFEKAIMHAYDYDSYMIGSYKPCMSMFVTGIKWPSMMLNPWYWFGKDQLLDSCLKEMDALVKIAWRHSTATSNRMKLVVHSYRHWRRNLLLTVALIAAATQSGTVIAGGKAAITAPVRLFSGASDNHHQIKDKVNTPLATAPNPKKGYVRDWLSSFYARIEKKAANTIAQPSTIETKLANLTPAAQVIPIDIPKKLAGQPAIETQTDIQTGLIQQPATIESPILATQAIPINTPKNLIERRAIETQTDDIQTGLIQQPITKHECPACPWLKFIQYNFLVDTLYKKSKPHCEFIDDCINIDTAR